MIKTVQALQILYCSKLRKNTGNFISAGTWPPCSEKCPCVFVCVFEQAFSKLEISLICLVYFQQDRLDHEATYQKPSTFQQRR